MQTSCEEAVQRVAPPRRWFALAVAWTAQATGAAVFLGVPAIGPQFADAYGLDLHGLAIVFAALTLGAGLSVIAWGALADLIGEPWVMVIGLGVAAASLALLAVAPGGVAVAAYLAIAGVGSASSSAASGRSVMRWFGPSERGLAMGIRQTALPVGAAAAALILPAVVASFSVRAAFATLAGACALTSIAIIPTLRGGSRGGTRQSRPRGRLLGDARLRRVVLVSALLSIPQLSLMSFLVVFLHEVHGWPVGRAAALLACIQVTGAAARLLAGRRSDLRSGERLRFLGRLAVVEVVALVALALAAPVAGIPLVVAVLAAGVSTLSWNGVAAVAAGELASSGRTGAAMGLQSSAVFLGGAAAAPGIAALASAVSWRAAFAALAVPAVVAVALLRRAGARQQPPATERVLAQALDGMSSAISLIDVRDAAEPVVYVNRAFERLTGYSAAEAVGRPWTIVEGPETDPATSAELGQAIRSGHEIRVRIRHHRRDQQPYWSETFLSPVVDGSGAISHYLSVQKDVTAQVEAEQRASHLAYHDGLTGLPNRAQVQEHLALALARATRRGTTVALLFLDLDGFKPANDRYGHDAGDQLLQAVVKRWRGVLRKGDVLARYGGDEFVVLMTGLQPAEARSASAAAAARFVAAVQTPFTVPDRPGAAIRIGVSVGIALYPDHASSISELLIAADAAMYEAKRGGGSAAASAIPLAS